MEGQLAENAGLAPGALRLDALVGGRDAGMLVFHDRSDDEVSIVQAEQLAARWPNARLVISEGLGHRRILRDPDVIAETVAFVRRGVAPAASDLVREVDRQLGSFELP